MSPRVQPSSTNRWPFLTWTLGMALVSIGALACAGDGTPATFGDLDGPMAGAPDWVLDGCSAPDVYEAETELCGMGSAAGSRNVSLARTAAMGRARSQIQRELETRLKAVLREILIAPKSATDGVETPPGSDSVATAETTDSGHIQNVATQISRLTIGASKLKESWVASDGTLYTLVTLNETDFTGRLAQTHTLSESIRESVLAMADSVFAPPAEGNLETVGGSEAPSVNPPQ